LPPTLHHLCLVLPSYQHPLRTLPCHLFRHQYHWRLHHLPLTRSLRQRQHRWRPKHQPLRQMELDLPLPLHQLLLYQARQQRHLGPRQHLLMRRPWRRFLRPLQSMTNQTLRLHHRHVRGRRLNRPPQHHRLRLRRLQLPCQHPRKLPRRRPRWTQCLHLHQHRTIRSHLRGPNRIIRSHLRGPNRRHHLLRHPHPFRLATPHQPQRLV